MGHLEENSNAGFNDDPDIIHGHIQLAMEAAEMVLWICDYSTRKMSYSSNLPSLIRTTNADEFQTIDGVLNRIHPDDRDAMRNAMLRSLRSSGCNEMEYRFQIPSGEWRWFLTRGETVDTASNDGARLIGLTMDITARKTAETALRESDERFREISEKIDSVLWITDPQLTKTHFVSTGYERIWRRKVEELGENPRAFLDCVHEADKAWVKECFLHTEDVRRSAFDMEYRILWPDGTVRWVSDHRSILFNDAGRPERMVGIATDITNRKTMEEALRLREEVFEAIVEQAVDAIALIDGESGRFVEFNSSAHEGLGYTREEFGRLTVEDIQAEHSREQIFNNIEQVRKEGAMAFDTVHRKRDGELLNVRVSVRSMSIRGNSYLAALWSDTTKQKKALAEIQFKNLLLETQQEASLDGVLVVDDQSRILSHNRRFVEMWGVPEEIADGPDDERLLNFIAQKVKDSQHFVERIEHLYANRAESGRDEIRLLDGRVFDRYSSPLIGADGRYYGRIWYFRDISERKRADMALHDMLMLRREAEKIGRLGAWKANPVTDYLYWTEGVYEIVEAPPGYKPAGLEEGMTLYDGDSIPVLRAALMKTYLDGTPFTLEVGLTTMTGKHLRTEVRGLSRIEEGGVTVLMGTFQDITERKHEEATRRNLEEQLQQAQKLESVGRLAGGIAHDFNNLLTVINGFSQLIQAKLPDADPMKDLMREISKAGERAADLTRQLLTFSRRQPVQAKVIQVQELIQESQAILDRLVGENISIYKCLDSDAGSVLADQGQLNQVLMNLIVNARDAMPLGGTIRLIGSRVYFDDNEAKAISGAREGAYVVLEVADDGEGMSDEVRLRAFEPFFTTKGEGKGTGLGLATVYGIVRQSGGWIQLESQPGKGTTVRIGLPELPDSSIAAAGVKNEPERLDGIETILVVEDQDEVRNYALTVLHEYKYRTLAARCGEEALLVARNHFGPIHLLLTDVMMPGMTGKQLAERMGTLHPETKTLYMSGYSADILSGHGLDQDSYIQKPFMPEALARKVRKALGEVRLPAKVLVVDDDAGIRNLFTNVLKYGGYDAVSACNLTEAEARLAGEAFDIALVELSSANGGIGAAIDAIRKAGGGARLIQVSSAAATQAPGSEGVAVLTKPVSPDQLLQAVRMALVN